MPTTTHPQLGLLDGLMSSTVADDFLERRDAALEAFRDGAAPDVSGYDRPSAAPAVGAFQNEPAPALLQPVRSAM